jgi:hypothetical protein
VKPPLLALMKQTAGVVWFHGQPWSTIDCTFGSFGLLFFCQRLGGKFTIAVILHCDATILPPWLLGSRATCHRTADRTASFIAPFPLPQNSRQNGVTLFFPLN